METRGCGIFVSWVEFYGSKQAKDDKGDKLLWGEKNPIARFRKQQFLVISDTKITQ